MRVLWRDPGRAGLLMGVYFLLSLATGPAISVLIGTGALSRVAGWAVLAFFVWRVTRGGRISRMLLVVVAAGGLIEAVALWRGRRPAPLVAALTAGVVLGLVGAAASATVICIRVRGYHADTVRVLAGHPDFLTLAPGRYGAFGGCADEWGCAQLAPRDLSVLGALSGDVGAIPYTRLEQRADAGQSFDLDLTFTVPVLEAVRIALNRNAGQPVLIAPTREESGLIHGEVVAATGCAALLLGSLAALGWPLAPRGRRHRVARLPLETGRSWLRGVSEWPVRELGVRA